MSLSHADRAHVFHILKEWDYLEKFMFIPPEDDTKTGYMINKAGIIMQLSDFVPIRKTVLLELLLCIDYQPLSFAKIRAFDSAIITLRANSPSIAELESITDQLYKLL